MADVNDIGNISGKLENEWEKLEDKSRNISPSERDTISAFVTHRKVNEGKRKNTLINDLGNLRRAAEWTDKDLVDMSLTDVNSFLRWLAKGHDQEDDEDIDGRGLDPEGTGMYNYKRALRIYFRYLHRHDEYDSYSFWKSIEMPEIGVQKVKENVKDKDLLTESEIQDLKEATTNPRDRALIDFLADTAGRITLILQLRVGDVHNLDSDEPYFSPNPEGVGHKDIDSTRKLPIMRSRAELRSYINRDHIDPQPDHPLWVVDSRHYDPENPKKSALSGDRARDMLKENARRAGIDEDRVHPHMFRHVTLTRLSRSDRLTPQEIQHIAGWYDQRMLEVYDHTSDEERNSAIHNVLGFSEGEDISEDEIERPHPCGNCREMVSPSDRFCPNCGAAVSEDAREAVEDVEDDIFTDAVDSKENDLSEALDEFRELVDENPALKSVLADK